MPIDVKTPGGVGWWMTRLTAQLHDQSRQKRLTLLDDWYRGEPPLPEGARNSPEAYKQFQKFAVSNFCELIPECVRERMNPIGIRTSSDGDATGDAEAWKVWRRAHLPLVSDEVHRLFLRFGESYALVNPPATGTTIPVVTAEDPRMVVGEPDVLRPWATVAGLKVFRDPVSGKDYTYLYRPGRVDVATRTTKQRFGQYMPTTANLPSLMFSPTFDGNSWTLDEELSVSLPDDLMCLVRFVNRDGVAEFERHIGLMARINHMILQRMTIATLQAFRQRGVKGLPDKDKDGNEIDYTGVFSADPGALWLLPEAAEMWESGMVDLGPILLATKEDVVHLAAVTQTPMHSLSPGGENQSAEGASMAREGLVFKTKDRIARVTPGWSAVLQTCFQWIAESTTGADREAAQKRADLDGIDVIWAPAENQSLTERASAASQAHAAGVPWRTIMIDVMGYSPERVDMMETERQDDLVFAQQLAFIKARATALATPAPVPTPPTAAPDATGTAPAAGDAPAAGKPVAGKGAPATGKDAPVVPAKAA